jgi:hypothetical protein
MSFLVHKGKVFILHHREGHQGFKDIDMGSTIVAISDLFDPGHVYSTATGVNVLLSQQKIISLDENSKILFYKNFADNTEFVIQSIIFDNEMFKITKKYCNSGRIINEYISLTGEVKHITE